MKSIYFGGLSKKSFEQNGAFRLGYVSNDANNLYRDVVLTQVAAAMNGSHGRK